MSRTAHGGQPKLLAPCAIAGHSAGSPGEGNGLSTRGRGLTKSRVGDVLDTEEGQGLLNTGREAGSLTAEEISLALDDLGFEPAQLDAFYATLEEQQIEVVPAAADVELEREEALTVSADSL